MRDIWNPWHGCRKVSEGCQNCYMYFLDAQRNKSGADIYRVKSNFDYPLHRDKSGNYKIRSGEFLRVCMTSDFFLEEADKWRSAAWNIMQQRSDVVFLLVTKRPERVLKSLPSNWGEGWENIWFHITTENQKRADERIPILLDLPFKHKGLLVAPFIGEISIDKFLKSGMIENVLCGGENYDGARPLYYEWVKKLSDECKTNDVTFEFFETGTIFVKDGLSQRVPNKIEQMKNAYLLNLNYKSKKEQIFKLTNSTNSQMGLFEGVVQSEFSDTLQEKHFKEHCKYCTMKSRCAGCCNCKKCGLI